MMLLDKTTEKLRSKHVRTLELLQKTIDENVALRDQLGQQQKGPLHLGQANATPRSNRAAALEEEIDRLKTEHSAKLLELDTASNARVGELQQSFDALQKKALRLENQVFTLETALFAAKAAVKDSKRDWDDERAQVLDENSRLRDELRLLLDANHTSDNNSSANDQQRDEQARLQQQQHQQLRDELAAAIAREADAQQQAQSVADRAVQLQREVQVVMKQLADQRATFEVLECEAANARERERELAHELAAQREHSRALQSDISQLHHQLQLAHTSTRQQQQQPNTDVASRHLAAEAQRDAFMRDNHALREQLARLQLQLTDLTRPSSNANASGVFAVHVELKRENAQLRAQVDELKQLQRRFLTTAKKKTMTFPAL